MWDPFIWRVESRLEKPNLEEKKNVETSPCCLFSPPKSFNSRKAFCILRPRKSRIDGKKFEFRAVLGNFSFDCVPFNKTNSRLVPNSLHSFECKQRSTKLTGAQSPADDKTRFASAVDFTAVRMWLRNRCEYRTRIRARLTVRPGAAGWRLMILWKPV